MRGPLNAVIGKWLLIGEVEMHKKVIFRIFEKVDVGLRSSSVDGKITEMLPGIQVFPMPSSVELLIYDEYWIAHQHCCRKNKLIVRFFDLLFKSDGTLASSDRTLS